MVFLYFLIFLPLIISNETSKTPICGNGLREEGEACDDGNGNDLDGCTKNCTVEVNYLCIKDPKTSKDICFKDIPLNAELKYIQHTSPPKLELFFSRPLIYSDIYMLSRSINIRIEKSMNNSFFYWTFAENADYSLRNQSFIISLFFSQSFHKKTLTLTFVDPYSFTDVFENKLSSSSGELTAKLPGYVILNKESQDYIRFIKVCVIVFVIVMFISCFNVSLMNSMTVFWNLFDTCQLFQILILVNCDYPQPVKEFLTSFSLTNFSFKEYITLNFDNKVTYNGDQNLSFWLSERDYSTLFLENAFFSLVFCGFFLLFYFILIGFSKFRSCPDSLVLTSKKLFGVSIILRTTIITYTSFCLAVMLQFVDFNFKGSFISINSLLTLLAFFYLIILPFIYLKLLNRQELIQEDETFKDKVQPLIEMLILKAILKRNFYLFYVMRKFLWICFLVFLWEEVLFQIFWVTLVQVSIITLHMLKKPYTDKNVNYMLLFSEIGLLIALFLIATLISFDYLNSDLDLDIRISISWTIVGIFSSIIFAKLCFLFIEIVQNIRYLIPKAKKMFKKFNDDDDNFIEMGDYGKNNNTESSTRGLNIFIEGEKEESKSKHKK